MSVFAHVVPEEEGQGPSEPDGLCRVASRRRMVVVQIAGGLGNQMFQYAAGRAFAAACGTRLYLDLSFYERKWTRCTPRRYGLKHFQIQGRPIGPLERIVLAPWRIRGGRHLARWLPRVVPRLRFRRVSEETAAADLGAVPPDQSIYLTGYWQSEKYFAGVEELIRKEFTLASPPCGENRELLRQIRGENAVCVHVRRGDYLRYPHIVLPAEYYARAVRIIESRVPEPHYFVFSDDPQAARMCLPPNVRATFVNHNGEEAPHEDLRLMIACTHFIIANSTFSWWAAWLARAPRKVVVAPGSRWGVQKSWRVDKLIPTSWGLV